MSEEIKSQQDQNLDVSKRQRKSLREAITARESESVPKVKWLTSDTPRSLPEKIAQRQRERVDKK